MVDVNPKMLKWAREQARLTAEEAAAMMGFQSSARSSATSKLHAIEGGRKLPTDTQLDRFSRVYRWPVIVFSLDAPPPPSREVANFRQAAAGGVHDKSEGWLDTLVSDFIARQEMVRSLLEDDEDFIPPDFVGSLADRRCAVDEAVADIRSLLDLAESESLGSKLASPTELLSELRQRIEALGVIVVLAGDLGSYHTKLGVEVFRGFTLVDEYAPFIVINSHDSKSAQSFTLLHELVHILLGSTGISGRPSIVNPENEIQRMERFCDDVASEVLLPDRCLTRSVNQFVVNKQAIEDLVLEVARVHRVSRLLVAYRLWRKNVITKTDYQQLDNRPHGATRDAQEGHTDGRGGPNYYVVRAHRLGNTLIGLVRRALAERNLTYTKAATILGVATKNLSHLLKMSEHRAVR